MPTDTAITPLDTGQSTAPRRHHIDKRAGALAAEIAAGGDPDELLSDSQLAELSGLSVQFFQIGRVKGYAPLFIRLSPRRVRTRRRDYVAWLEQRTHLRTSEYADPLAPRMGRKPGSRVVGGKVLRPEEGGDAA
jgi:hypothetical protein